MKINSLTDSELQDLLATNEFDNELRRQALALRRNFYGNKIFIRGLIEFTNYCHNNCYYCGLRCENKNLVRYRLNTKEILACADKGYALGFRTFVLQGGEDDYFSDEVLVPLIRQLHQQHPDAAITLSIGERSKESYKALFKAGAERYLLRHETANAEHYAQLHPVRQSFAIRQHCLQDLKEIGYVVGSGFMVGSPGQTAATLIEDLRFLQKLNPDMIGIGPFIHHADTPFADMPNGDLQLTLRLIAILRIMFPTALIPATTALATLSPEGRNLGLAYGANVLMPNLTPVMLRKSYSLYDNKASTGLESAEYLEKLKNEMTEQGWKIVVDRGNPVSGVEIISNYQL
ncbi:MAG: [FeFe] hydrogenase H-cluster radical SAM maturase HydE [Acidaminococcaceae bacterium]|nr:[FeFe] hydrogenase H-cluster radical SAM maturase HydE [Acidaminococcaceae bacterium]MDO4935271.1 [FeFe] hydrogenase H-cluster radical SAM maturase HydE [Phascolarctobacterium sp.]